MKTFHENRSFDSSYRKGLCVYFNYDSSSISRNVRAFLEDCGLDESFNASVIDNGTDFSFEDRFPFGLHQGDEFNYSPYDRFFN